MISLKCLGALYEKRASSRCAKSESGNTTIWQPERGRQGARRTHVRRIPPLNSGKRMKTKLRNTNCEVEIGANIFINEGARIEFQRDLLAAELPGSVRFWPGILSWLASLNQICGYLE